MFCIVVSAFIPGPAAQLADVYVDRLWPAIGIDSVYTFFSILFTFPQAPVRVSCNFGRAPFLYDVIGQVSERHQAPPTSHTPASVLSSAETVYAYSYAFGSCPPLTPDWSCVKWTKLL